MRSHRAAARRLAHRLMYQPSTQEQRLDVVERALNKAAAEAAGARK